MIQGLDKYLTSPPDDGFDGWAEDVLGNKISDEFYAKNTIWLEEYNGICNKWLCKMFYKKSLNPDNAAKLLERAFKFYIN